MWSDSSMLCYNMVDGGFKCLGSVQFDEYPELILCFFFFNDPAPTKISPLSLPDALPIFDRDLAQRVAGARGLAHVALNQSAVGAADARDRLAGREMHDRIDVHRRIGLTPAKNGQIDRSEEHTSELQSQSNLVCRLRLAQK